MEAAVADVKGVLPDTISEDKKRWYAVKFLENDSKVVESMNLSAAAKAAVDKDRKELETKHDDDMESIVTDERYKFIQKIVETTVKKGKDKLTTSDKIDRIVTNRILGIPIFIAVMFIVYYISVTTIGTIVTDWTNDTFVGAIQDIASKGLEAAGISSVIEGLVVDGIIGGIGAVLGFVPQMAILFLFLSILEDCGYMVRIAFVMDRVFRHFGLSGKSFIPLLISSGCGIPGIMASKTIEQTSDNYDSNIYPMRSEVTGYRINGWSYGKLRNRKLYSRRTYGANHVFCRYRSSISSSNHPEEDKTILRKTGTIRYGASTVSRSTG